MYVLIAILIFGVLIAVHEWGHFAAAKLCGVQVNEFSIGMGPEVWSRQKGETQYSLRLLPVGGFCAMEGEMDADSSENPRALNNQGFWKKLIIFAAGALMNLVTGFVLILLLVSGAHQFLTPEISGMAPEFEARNGVVLMDGDVFYSINHQRILIYDDVDLLLSFHRGEPLDLVVLRGEEKVALNGLVWDTYTSFDGETQYQGYGIFRRAGVVEATPLRKLQYSALNTADFARIVWLSLQMLVHGQAGMDDISGPVGIVSTITEVGQEAETTSQAMAAIIYIAALITVNLAVMNLLPIPALDGGHILFLVVNALISKLFGKQIPAKYEQKITNACFGLLMAFMVYLVFHDVLMIIR